MISTDRGISRPGFLRAGAAVLQESEQILGRVFDVIDKKNPEYISWTEFLSAVMIMKCGSAEERFELFI
jgi:Ca2+-binding EF-hand superfamily protein